MAALRGLKRFEPRQVLVPLLESKVSVPVKTVNEEWDFKLYAYEWGFSQ